MSSRMRIARLVVALSFVLAVQACVGPKAHGLEVLIADGASDVRSVRTDDGRRYQLAYRVTLPFPATAVGKPQIDELERRGWKQCQGPTLNWDSFLDESAQQFVFQKTRYWQKGEELLTVNMRYATPASGRQVPPAVPDNTTQLVTVLLYAYGQDLDRVRTALQISC